MTVPSGSYSELRQHLEAGRPWLDPMTWLLVDDAEAETERLRDGIRAAWRYLFTTAPEVDEALACLEAVYPFVMRDAEEVQS